MITPQVRATYRFQFLVTGGFGACPGIQGDCPEEVVGAQTNAQSKHEMCQRVVLCFCVVVRFVRL